jgi:prepilin-type N-terminal cleavage/methylation domain-containing protein
MIQRIRGEKGFTLIELMIVIAIIGILAAIAIPNFIAYRDKAFCSQTESDANNIAAGLADYFSIPSNVSYTNTTDGTNVVTFPGSNALTLSGKAPTANTATVNAASVDAIVIAVTDGSGRCPASYKSANADWAGNVFTKNM